MSEFLGLVSGDNIFKYSFTLGIAMIVFAIVYPMGKRHELELDKIKFREEVTLTTLEVKVLKKKVEVANEQNKYFKVQEKQFAKLPAETKNKIRKEFKIYSTKLDAFESDKQRINIKQAKIQSIEERVRVLSNQISEFALIGFILKVTGSLLTLFGFIGWISQTFWNKPPR